MLTIREKNVDVALHAELKRQLSDAKSETASLRQELELAKIPVEVRIHYSLFYSLLCKNCSLCRVLHLLKKNPKKTIHSHKLLIKNLISLLKLEILKLIAHDHYLHLTLLMTLCNNWQNQELFLKDILRLYIMALN